jgi:hypothetical protein
MELSPFPKGYGRSEEIVFMALDWKEDDRDTLVLFLETILDGHRKGKLSCTQATSRIIEAFSQAGLSSRSITAYMQSVIQEQQSTH